MSDLISREDVLAIVQEWTYCSDVEDLVRALPAVQPKVKPLVWERGIVDWAKPLPGMKYVACSTIPEGYWAWWLDGTDVRSVEPDEESAKAAAQADYEARILSALEPAVQPDAAAIREAALREALETCLTTMERADFADGWCCCGDDMLNHPSPMDCGHSPVDMGEYHASLAIKNARAALNTGKEAK
jgi:hypothetical protein